MTCRIFPVAFLIFYELFLPMVLFSATETIPIWMPFPKLLGHRSYPLNGEDNEFRISNFSEDINGSRFDLLWKESPSCKSAEYAGLFNARNLAMAVLASVLSQQYQSRRNIRYCI